MFRDRGQGFRASDNARMSDDEEDNEVMSRTVELRLAVKKALKSQLSKANAVKLLQQKKLANLNEQMGSSSSYGKHSKSALSRLSKNDKLKIRQKMKTKLMADDLVQRIARYHSQIIISYSLSFFRKFKKKKWENSWEKWE